MIWQWKPYDPDYVEPLEHGCKFIGNGRWQVERRRKRITHETPAWLVKTIREEVGAGKLTEDWEAWIREEKRRRPNINWQRIAFYAPQYEWRVVDVVTNAVVDQ